MGVKRQYYQSNFLYCLGEVKLNILRPGSIILISSLVYSRGPKYRLNCKLKRSKHRLRSLLL